MNEILINQIIFWLFSILFGTLIELIMHVKNLQFFQKKVTHQPTTSATSNGKMKTV
jgi:hypothetical protein